MEEVMEDNSGMREIIDDLKRQIQEKLQELEKFQTEQRQINNREELEKYEQEVASHTDGLAGLMVGLKLQESAASEEIREKAKQLVKSQPKGMKNQGLREVEVKVARGAVVRIKSDYYSGKSDGRKKRGSGFYPALVMLGIYEGCTPSLAQEISAMAVLLGSFEEARQVLLNRGSKIDVKTVRAISYRTAQRARLLQQSEQFKLGENLTGRRVIISSDGGRIRIRKTKRGQKTKKGRNRYSTYWREPKVMIIYTVTAKGEMDRSYSPFIDGTLKGPDALFGLLAYYLSELNICSADKIVFIADGAPWIWKRLPKLFKSLGLNKEQVFEVIDFYHVVEHLGKVAALRKSWNSSERKRWVKHQRKLLLNGKANEVIAAIDELCRGRSGKAISRERNYFFNNINRLNYAQLSALGLPIGSGAVESAIRRVVNLRIKGPGIFWLRENAEAILMMRSFYKAGRWNLFKNMAFAPSLPMAA